MRLRRAAAACLLWAGAAAAAPPAFAPLQRAADVRRSCDAALLEADASEARLARADDGEGVLLGLDRLNQLAEDHLYWISFLANVHPDKALRDAAESCERRYQAHSTRLLQNRRIHARLKALQPADAIDARLRDELLADFEDAGVALPGPARERARTLADETARLAQVFERRVREDRSRVALSEAELDGVPPAVWQRAPRDARGRRLLGLDAPTYNAVVESARSAAARERIWRAYQRRGGTANLATLARITQLRREYARLFGQASWADFALRRRMAGDVAHVRAFLDEVRGAVAERERRDIADLRAAKAAELGVAPGSVRLRHWDTGYYIERVRRERHALDQERLRRHFPPQASVEFVMALAGRLFGVGFRPLPQTLWHADARAYEVFERADGRVLATLYLDLHPRPDKYGHAAVWPLRGSSTRDGRLPVAALVTNVDRQGLTLDELETLLHEFGHALHVTLSKTRYSSNAGTNVKLDFAEAPSQMLEEWVYDAAVLALCTGCEPLPAEPLARAVASRGFAKGIKFARQHLYASYDLALHGPDAPEPLAAWRRLEGATPLGHEPGSLLPASFDHLVGGYAAGYYAYLWSLATAQDLHTAFAANPLDAAVGRRWRERVLAEGGQVDPAELVRRFLGRAPGNAAFFRWLER